MIWTLYKKEMKSYLLSPLAYVLTGLFSLICGWVFFSSVAKYVSEINAAGPMGAENIKFHSTIIEVFYALNILFVLVVPLITMRLISQEKKNHTLELLFAAPISDWQILIAKYFSALSMTLLILVTSLVFPIVLYFSGLEDFSFFWSGYLSLFLNLSAYCAIGLLGSSLSKNQLIAVFISGSMILFLYLIAGASNITSNYYFVELFRYLGITLHFDYIRNGILHLHSLFYFLSVILMSLLVTKKILNSRNW